MEITGLQLQMLQCTGKNKATDFATYTWKEYYHFPLVIAETKPRSVKPI